MLLKEQVFENKWYVRMYYLPENANTIGRSLFSVGMKSDVKGISIINCSTYDEAEKYFNKFINECL